MSDIPKGLLDELLGEGLSIAAIQAAWEIDTGWGINYPEGVGTRGIVGIIQAAIDASSGDSVISGTGPRIKTEFASKSSK